MILISGGIVLFPVLTSCGSKPEAPGDIEFPFKKPDNWDPVKFNIDRGASGAIPKEYMKEILAPDGIQNHLGKHLPYVPKNLKPNAIPDGYIGLMWGDPAKGYAEHPNARPNESNNNEGHWYNWIKIRKAVKVYAETAVSTYTGWPGTNPQDTGYYAVKGDGEITQNSGKNTIYVAMLPKDVKSGDTLRIWAHCLRHGEYVDFITL